MTRKLLITAALAAAVGLSACSTSPFEFGSVGPTGWANVSPVGSPPPWYTPSGVPYDPAPCQGPSQLGKSPCPTDVYPYARDVTAGGGGRE